MAEHPPHATTERPDARSAAPEADRRTMLRRLTVLLGGGLTGALTLPAAVFLGDPLFRRRPADAALPVARSAEVPDLDRGDAPLRAKVLRHGVVDAWQRSEATQIGAVWLYRQRGALVCLSTQCPHTGCSVDFDASQRCFRCPCHDSSFALDGARQSGPAPRDLDRLPVEEREGRVLCRFQRFRSGVQRREQL